MKNAIEEKKRGMTPEETAFIERFVADYCRPHAVVEAERLTAFAAARQMSFMARGGGDFALAAGPSAPVQPEIRAPEEEVTFTFASEGAPDAPQAWRASLTVPPQAGPETMLTLAVSHAAGEPYERASSRSPAWRCRSRRDGRRSRSGSSSRASRIRTSRSGNQTARS